MAISPEEVDKIAKLSRLSFSEAEKQKFQQELSSILDYVAQIKEVENKTVDAEHDPDSINLMRDDLVFERESTQEFIKQAPDRQDNFIKVKSILE